MATMNSGLGGSSGYGENSFKTTGPDIGDLDDGSVYVDVTSVFGGSGINFFGTNYTGLYINSNGLLTFGTEEIAYDPQGLAGYDTPAIVPFWTDIHIGNGGDIYWDLDPAAGTFTVTWLDVAPYNGSGNNSFQLVLTDTGGGNFDIDFIYEDIQFSDGYVGDATTGVTDGDGHVYELEGSGDGAVLTTYETNDFDGGDPDGTYSMTVVNGLPDAIVVDGTAGADSMALGYTDAEGQEITTTDDYIDGGDGDDTIDGDTGDDTIAGGAGDDIILSGSHGNAGAPVYTDVDNGDDLHGTSGQDFYRWTAAPGSSATIRMNYTPSVADAGDGVADYVVVATTNDTGTLTIGDFDVGVDRIVLPEDYAGISISDSNGYASITITYANGNQQHFGIYHDSSPPISASAIFTTEAPVTTQSDDDTLLGGAGDDTFVLEDQFGSDSIDGGDGSGDQIDASGLTSGITATFSGSGSGSLSDGQDTLTFENIEEMTLTSQSDSVDASASGSSVLLSAGDGDDTLQGSTTNDTLIGGLGDDSLTGNDGDDLFVLTTSGGRDTISDFDTSDDDVDGVFNDQIDVSDLTGGSGPGGAVTTRDVVVSDDGAGNALLTFPGGEELVLGGGITPAMMTGHANLYAAGIPCFTAGTLIDTTLGPRPVEALKPGDMLPTADAGPQPVLWVGQTVLSPARLRDDPRLWPVTLRAGGVLGLPAPITVSRQHRLLLSTGPGRVPLGGGPEACFLRANQLLRHAPDQAFADCPPRGITYVHVLLARHQVIFADGIATESFYPGPWSLPGLCAQARSDLLRVMPQLQALAQVHPDIARQASRALYGPLARPELRSGQLRRLLRSGSQLGACA
ncbi:Hint domain-containing protein [Epibacterium sp. Ofav1-8]|uniref:Hint domain-containing protein n=1 Tax=Epibacterium sp. Ofav1-8 TaxID=2917735 RepID=UPI00272E3D28|nr:Hint domain-containing protein [Epibacterium sp. Ofav1-8]